MRTYFHIANIVVAAVLLSACSDVNDFGTENYVPSPYRHYLHLSQYALDLPADPSTRQLQVNADNTYWYFDGYDSSWLSLSPDEGSGSATVSVSATANLSAADLRTSVFWLTSNGVRDFSYRQQVSVTQQKAAPYVSVRPDKIQFEAAGGVSSLAVSANVSWQAVVSAGGEWLTAEKSDASHLTIRSVENLTNDFRTATVLLQGDGASASITVTQQTAASPTVSPTTAERLSFPNTGGSYSLTISSEVAWTATAQQSWIDVQPASGKAGRTNVVITAAPNATTSQLEGSVTVNIGTDARLTIPVTIGSSYFRLVNSAPLDFGRDEQTLRLNVESNVPWTVISRPSWLTVSPQSGSGNQELRLTVPFYQADEDRSGTLTLGMAGTTLQQSVAVRQSCRYFSLTPTVEVTMPSRGGTHQLHIATNDPWTATSTSQWMQLSARSGQRSVDVVMTTPDNPSVNPRRDVTTFKPADFASVSIATTQQARYLKVGTASLTFFYKGGTSPVVSIDTDADFTVKSSAPSWLTIQQTGKTFSATASKNETGTERKANITVAMTGLVSGESYQVNIPVSQRFVSSDINVTPWPDDQQWDVSKDNFSITITGFQNDQEWDASKGSVSITVTGFQTELQWE